MASTFIPYVGPRIIPTTVDLKVNMLVNTNQIMNVFQFKYNATPSAANLNQLCQDFGTAYYNAVKADLVNNVQFISVQARDIGAAGRANGSYNYPNGTYAGDGGSPVALNEAASVLLKTAKTGRRFKGRKSISGFPESKVNGNSFGSEILGLIARVGVELLKTWVAGQFTPAVAALPKVTSAGPPQVIGAVAEVNPITFVSPVDTNIDSQKTRLNGRGN